MVTRIKNTDHLARVNITGTQPDRSESNNDFLVTVSPGGAKQYLALRKRSISFETLRIPRQS